MQNFLTQLLEACRSKYGLAAAAILLAALYAVLSGCSLTKIQTATDGSTVKDQLSLNVSGAREMSENPLPQSMKAEPAE